MKYGGGMNELPYPSDLTAVQCALIEPLLPAPKPKGRKRRVDLRKITNAILYVLKGGVSWRKLPREQMAESPKSAKRGYELATL